MEPVRIKAPIKKPLFLNVLPVNSPREVENKTEKTGNNK